MNFNKPIQLIFAGSIILGFLVLLTLFLVDFLAKSEMGMLILFGVPVLCTLVSFVVFYYIVEGFLNKRIKLIYRVISNRKLSTDSNSQFSLSEDILGQLTKDTAQWADTQKEQIKKLEEQAAKRSIAKQHDSTQSQHNAS